MNKKALLKISVVSLLLIVILSLSLLVILSLPSGRASNSESNKLSVAPPEIQNKIPVATTKDINWSLEWFETFAGLTHREYVIAVQNQKLTNENFNLSVLFDNLNFDASQIKNVDVFEWKSITVNWNETICSNTTEYNATNSSYTYPVNCSEINKSQNKIAWKKAKDLITQEKTDKIKKEKYGSILIDKYGSKQKDDTENGTKFFKLAFDIPIIKQADGTWGSSGKVAFVEETSNTQYHPTWNIGYDFSRILTFNNTVASKVKMPQILNGSTDGINSTIVWVFPDEGFSTSTNLSQYLYYNNWNNISVINFSENKQLPHDSEDSRVSSLNPYEVWQDNNVSGVWHLNSTLNSAQALNNVTWSGTTSYTTGKIGQGRRFSGVAGSWGSMPHSSDYEANNFSVCAWVNFSNTGSTEFIIDKNGNVAGEWDLNKGSGDLFEWTYRRGDAIGIAINSVTKPIVNTWIHVCGTYNDEVLGNINLTIYVNGTAEASSLTLNSARGSGSGNLTFGARTIGDLLMNGSIDEIIYFNHTLSPHEVKAYYESMTKKHSELGAVSNTNPIIQNISISPTTAYTNSTLNCSANYGDADSDKGNVSITWYNGSTQYGGTLTILNVAAGALVSNVTSAGIIAKSETWNCTINATDSNNGASALNSTTRDIINTIPEITKTEILPSTVYKTSNLTTNITANDVDLDTLTCFFLPFKDNIPQTSLQKSFTGITNGSNQIYNLTNTSYSKNEVWLFQTWCNDTSNSNSSLVNTSSKTIQNSVPTTTSLTLTPSSGITKNTIGVNCTINGANDDDADALTHKWQWFRNNIASVTTQNITNSTFNKDDVLVCQGWVSDNAPSNSTLLNSSSVNVGNTAPSIDAVAMNETSATKLRARINSSLNYTDVDGDAVTPNFRWYIDNIATNIRTSFITNSTYNKSNVLILEVWVNDSSNANSSLVNTSSLTIDNTAPTTPEIGGVENNTRTTGNSQTLRCANSTDVDSDTINYVFYGDTTANPTTLLQNTTGTTYTWATADGSTYYWRCKAEDSVGGVSAFTEQKTFTENTAPPTVIMTSPANNSRTIGNSVNIQWNSSIDAEGDTVNYALYADTSNPPTTLRQNTTGTSYTLATTDGSVYYTRIKVQDGYETAFGLISTFTENTAPTLPDTGGFINNSRRTGNSVTLRCENSTDAETDTITYAMYFDTNSNPTTLIQNTTGTTSTQSTTDGSTYYYKCKAQDSYETSAFTGIINFTENTAPPQPTLSLPTNNSRVNATTLLTVNSVTDAEGDTVTYAIVGDTSANPSALLQNTTGLTYNWTLTRGNSYWWRAKAQDGYETSAYSPQFNFTSNSLPTISAIALDPATAYTNSTLNCSANFSDAEGDKLNATFTYYNGTSLYSSITIRNIASTNTNSSYALTSSLQNKGEKWNCSVNAFDGYENSTTSEVERTISNTIPEITKTEILPSTVYKTSNLTTNITANDVDLDTLTCHFLPFKDNIPQPSLQKSFTGITNGSTQIYNLTNTSYAKGEVWLFQEWCNDTSNANSSLVNTSSKTIQNTAPITTSLTLTPSSGVTKNTIGVNCTINGANDDDADTLTHKWQWFRNNIASVTTQNITNSTFSKDDVLICQGWVYDNAPSNSTLLNSSSVTVGNTAPTLDTSVVLNVTSATKLTTQINCSMNGSDIDNDALTGNFRWFIDNIPTANTTSFITNRSYNKSNVLICQGWLSDGTPSNSSLGNSSSLTIDNTAPTSVTLYNNDTNTTDTTPTFNWSKSSDADNDILSYGLEIYNDSKMYNQNRTFFKVVSQNYTLSETENLSDGRYYWRSYATDNSSNSSRSDNSTILVDATAPDLTISYPTQTQTISSSVAITLIATYNFSDNLTDASYCYYNVTKESLTGSTIHIENTTIANCEISTSFSFSVSQERLGDNYYSINIWGNNSAGLNSSLRRKFYFDDTSGGEEGGGGGAGGGLQYKELLLETRKIVEEEKKSLCGNSACDANEDIISCRIDCPFNLEKFLSGEVFKEAWFLKIMWILIGVSIVVFTAISVEKANKRKITWFKMPKYFKRR